ncbi:hypothetical protein PM082_013732 [Marasmius tenuissimus]|nr:hypothetical protein PM082_013732 [Marasmius tenuissimus]
MELYLTPYPSLGLSWHSFFFTTNIAAADFPSMIYARYSRLSCYCNIPEAVKAINNHVQVSRSRSGPIARMQLRPHTILVA